MVRIQEGPDATDRRPVAAGEAGGAGPPQREPARQEPAQGEAQEQDREPGGDQRREQGQQQPSAHLSELGEGEAGTGGRQHVRDGPEGGRDDVRRVEADDRHADHARHHRHHRTHAGQEACEHDALAAVAGEEALAGKEQAGAVAERPALPEMRAETVADPERNAVAQHRSGRRP